MTASAPIAAPAGVQPADAARPAPGPDGAPVSVVHTIAVGAGPANLSLAALHQTARPEPMAVFDRQPGPAWHEGLLHPGVRMQTSWLKDLVSVVDPTHRLSFLNYMVTTGRLFALLNSQFDVIPRREYQRYLAWAVAQLDGVHYGVDVDEISFDADGFRVSSGGRPLAVSEHLVIGVGTRPTFPAALEHLPRERVFVADHLALRLPAMTAAPDGADGSDGRDAVVAVIGGGQTGAEAVQRLLGAGFTRIKWIGRGAWFHTIDDSPVANDFFRPEHQAFLQGLAVPTRRRLVGQLRYTADALTPGYMRGIYQANYEGFLERGEFPVQIMLGHDVVGGTADGGDVVLRCQTVERPTEIAASHVVVAVGREPAPVPFDDELRELIDLDESGELSVEADYSIRWKGMNGHRIYVFNRARLTHGIPDANLTLLPVRAALVLNSMFQQEVYRIPTGACAVTWG